MTVDLSQLVPCERMHGDDDEDTALLKDMLVEARRYMSSYSWCERIDRCHFGLGVGGVVAVFLFEITPASDEVDSMFWVVVGDVPPAYLVTDELKEPRVALRAYVDEMRAWIEAVRKGDSLDEVIPVNAPPTVEYADRLETRLKLLESEVIGTG